MSSRFSADIDDIKKFISVLSAFMVISLLPSSAQKIGISTNLLGYLSLGTMNMELSYSVSRHLSITADVRYNPFTFHPGDPERQFQCRQQSYAAGVRYWLWHSMSGWWFSGKVRYQEYNYGGIWSPQSEEGDKVGVGLYAGYTHMLARHWNIEFGAGLWTGAAWFRRYDCPMCGFTVAQGRKWFLLPDDLAVSIAYVF